MGSISMGLTPKSQEEENKEKQVSTVSEAKLKKINTRREKSEERKNGAWTIQVPRRKKK